MSNRSYALRFYGFVTLLCALALTLVPMLAKAAFASSTSARNAATGTLTMSGTVADAYEAYRLFDAKVADGDSGNKIASDIVWASDAVRDAVLPVLREAGMNTAGAVAQDVAEWLDADGHMTPLARHGARPSDPRDRRGARGDFRRHPRGAFRRILARRCR